MAYLGHGGPVRYDMVMAILHSRTTLTGSQIVIFDQYLAFALITPGPSPVMNILMVHNCSLRVTACGLCAAGYSTYASYVSRNQQMPSHHSSVNLVYDRKL